MPTKKPRISFVIPENLYDLLKTYEKEYDCKNQSQAIIRLIEIGYEKLSNQPIHVSSELASKRDFFKKFESLDAHGKDLVKTVLAKEYKRCINQAEQPEHLITIPYSFYKVSAGGGFLITGDENNEMLTIKYNQLTRKADFCIEVSGDSMEPKYHDKDIILIRKQPAVDIGEIGIFILNECAYVKINGKKELLSLNPEYENIKKNTNITCWGKVLGKLKKEWIM